MSEFVQCLRLDSQFRTSGTGSNFQIELADNLQCGPTTQCFVSAVSFPASFFTIEYNVNDRVYLVEIFGATKYNRVVYLQPGDYSGPTFAPMLENALNGKDSFNARDQTLPAYDVFWAAAEGRFVIQMGDAETPTRSWQFLSDSQLASGLVWQSPAPAYDTVNPRSANNVIRLESDPGLTINNGTYVTGIFDADADWHVLYLHSDLTSFKSSGPRKADRDVIARIPVTVSRGYMNHWEAVGHAYQTIPVPSISLKNLRFTLTNARGDVVDLHGGNISIELWFADSALF